MIDLFRCINIVAAYVAILLIIAYTSSCELQLTTQANIL